ncbi:MAG: glycosyltransferase [Thomasclavelia spiroformis]
MKIVFAANYFTHHQEQLSLDLKKISNNNYYYIASDEFPIDRVNSGYQDMNKKYDFIIRPYESERQRKLADKLVIDADLLIIGSAPNKYIKKRMKYNKLTIIYSERLFKKSRYRRYIPTTYKKIYDRFLKYVNKNLYVICSSSFTSYDLNLCGFNSQKCFKWGYFPNLYKEDYKLIADKKNRNNIEILWVARFIECKDPFCIIDVVSRLLSTNQNIHLTMIGEGPLLDKSKKLCAMYNIENYITFTGGVSQIEVFEYMKKADIFTFTSNKQEGWGAVLNEAMSCGCCVIAGDQIGSVPFLIDNKIDGFIYETGNNEDLYNKLSILCNNKEVRDFLGHNAYNKIHDIWNVTNASLRLYNLIENILEDKDVSKLYESGPCSIANIYDDDWFRR